MRARAEPLMSYAGLRSPRFTAKYERHGYVRVGRYRVRQLSAAECERFRQHVEAVRNSATVVQRCCTVRLNPAVGTRTSHGHAVTAGDSQHESRVAPRAADLMGDA